MRDHRKLAAFQLADKLIFDVYLASKRFAIEERFGLTGQIRRAAISIGTNIVEGSARISKIEYLRFLNIAFASARELQYELSLANRLGYLETKKHEEIENLTSRVCSALYALIKSLR